MQGFEVKLKLDLHTHCYVALCFSEPNPETVYKIIEAVKARGLDGIAITDHSNKSFGYKVKEVVERYFDSEILIIPGQEIDEWPVEIVELYLPNNTTFRFLAHPGLPGDFIGSIENIHNLHGIEIENAGHNWHMDKQKISEIAERHNLLLLSNRDAHYLDDIGKFYNEISLEQLWNRAKVKQDNNGDSNIRK